MTDQNAEPQAAAPVGRLGLLRRRLWPRGAIMLAFLVLTAVAETVLAIITVLQAGWLGVTGAANPRVTRFGADLGTWLRDVARFQSCATEDRPFPWAEWPRQAAPSVSDD
jgi:hypothetical protein